MPNNDPVAATNRAFVSEVAFRRGITLGHLSHDGGCELAQIMRRLDEAERRIAAHPLLREVTVGGDQLVIAVESQQGEDTAKTLANLIRGRYTRDNWSGLTYDEAMAVAAALDAQR